jgi:hypothetical protein
MELPNLPVGQPARLYALPGGLQATEVLEGQVDPDPV